MFLISILLIFISKIESIDVTLTSDVYKFLKFQTEKIKHEVAKLELGEVTDPFDKVKNAINILDMIKANYNPPQSLVFQSEELESSSSLSLHRSGLSKDCNNKLCEMYAYALSSKSIGIGIRKICAKYILGYVFECPRFPSADDFVNAPSVCSEDIASMIGIFSGGETALVSLLENFLYGNFKKYCYEDKFESFLHTAVDFYSTCTTELLSYPNNVTYTVAVLMQNYFELYNQVCVFNNASQNCWNALNSLDNSSSTSVDIYDSYCDYFPLAVLNRLALQQICAEFSAFGCCYGNQLGLMSQNQFNESNILQFPPCLQRYLSIACPGADSTTLCTYGSTGDMTIISGIVHIGSTASTVSSPILPNMYDKNQVFYLQGVLINALSIVYTTEELESLGLFTNKPFTVEITGYTYYQDDTALSPADGTPYNRNGGDYSLANHGSFNFNFKIAGLSDEDSQRLYTILSGPQTNPEYAYVVGYSYGGTTVGAATTVTINATQGNQRYYKDSIDTNSGSMSGISFIWINICMIISVGLMLHGI